MLNYLRNKYQQRKEQRIVYHVQQCRYWINYANELVDQGKDSCALMQALGETSDYKFHDDTWKSYITLQRILQKKVNHAKRMIEYHMRKLGL